MHSTPIRVLIDGRKLGPNGIGVYTENLIAALAVRNEVKLSVIFAPELQTSETLNAYTWSEKIEKIWYSAGLYSLKEYLLLGKFINSGNWDLFHAPHYTLPFGIRAKTIVTIHDLIHIANPERWYYPLVAKFLIGSALRRADLVLTVSQASKNELALYFPRIKKEIRVIPNILSKQLISVVDQQDIVKQKYFLAVVSTWKPHKGVKTLIEAFSKFYENNQTYSLRLVGSGIAKAIDANELSEYNNHPGLNFMGRVSDQELQSLYQNATAVCVASTSEGFCLPVLEAHANFCPVLCRPVPALTELLIENFDLQASDWSLSAFQNLFSNFAARLEFINKQRNHFQEVIREQLIKFSGETVSELLIQAYQDCLKT